MYKRQVFRCVESVLPLWMQRTIGLGAKYGKISSLNPAIIIVLVPLMQSALAKYDLYNSVILGTAITGVAPFALSLITPASYGATALFMVVLSIGEAIYSPRLSDYILRLSPRGSEGAYASLLSLPNFTVKAFSGTLGGHLLADWCPRPGARDCYALWTVEAFIALTGPAAMYGFRSWLYDGHVRARLEARV